jgi:hypothetical protein
MLARLDWRTREAKLLTAVRAELTAHLGGSPNAVQRALIERASRLTVYIEAMDREALESGGMSERNSKQYLAWIGQLRLTLREIGVRAAPPKGEAGSLADYLTSKAGGR